MSISVAQEGKTALDHAMASLKEKQDEHHVEKMNAVIAVLHQDDTKEAEFTQWAACRLLKRCTATDPACQQRLPQELGY